MKTSYRSLISTILFLLLVAIGVDLIHVSNSFADAVQPIFCNSHTYISTLAAKQPNVDLHSSSGLLLLSLLESDSMPCECSSATESAFDVRSGRTQRVRSFNSTTRGKLIPLFSITKDFSEDKKTLDDSGEFPSFSPELDGLTNIRKTE